MTFSLKPLLSACLLAANCAAPAAFAETITFDSTDVTSVAIRPTIITTQGFVFTALDYELLGQGVAPYTNGTNMLQFAPYDILAHANTNAVTFRRQDAALFNLNSLEFSPGAYANNAAQMGIKGIFADGTTVSRMVEVQNGSGLTLVGFEGWNNLAAVVLTGNLLSQSYVQVDNINVAAVPEPETYAMLVAGLGLMGVVARKRKSSAQRAS